MLIAIGILAALVVVLATWHVALHSGLIEVELKKRASRELPKTPPSKPLPPDPPIGAHGTRLARDYYPLDWYVNSVNYNPYGMANLSYHSVFAPARFNGAGNLVHSLEMDEVPMFGPELDKLSETATRPPSGAVTKI